MQHEHFLSYQWSGQFLKEKILFVQDGKENRMLFDGMRVISLMMIWLIWHGTTAF